MCAYLGLFLEQCKECDDSSWKSFNVTETKCSWEQVLGAWCYVFTSALKTSSHVKVIQEVLHEFVALY